MASANLDLARSIYAAWERGDWSSSEWAHPDIETVMADGPAPGRSTRVAGAAELWRNFLNAWEGYRSEAEEYRELDDERVLVLIRRSGRGKRSGIELGEIQARGASVFHIRDGKVTRQVVYFERKRAFADLGLAPEDSPDS
jgi:ketosteroid isomerase-like protein